MSQSAAVPTLSRRATALAPSPTIAIDTRAKQLAAEGADVVNLGIGEPDFATPGTANEGGIAAIRRGMTKYTPAAGTLDLRKAIGDKLRRENGLDYAPEQIVVSNGAKHSIYNALLVLVDAGDEVVMQSPYWVSYPEMVKLCDGVPVIVETDASTGFRMTPAMIEAKLSPRSRVLLLNNPSNPTGVVYAPEELRDIVELAVDRGLAIISDEIYEKLLFGNARFASVAAFSDAARRATITINGFSKAYAMTGWRMGYAASEKPLARAMADLQGQTTSAPSSITQEAARAALTGDQSTVETMRLEFDRRRRYVIDRLGRMRGVSVETEPLGAFYVFPNVSGTFGRDIRGSAIRDADDLAMRLLDLEKVALVPGSGFGSPAHVRISYAASMERLAEGMDRLERFLA
jgi:aspartate aminotransferase